MWECRKRVWTGVGVLALAVCHPSMAVQKPQHTSSLHDAVVAPAGFVATVVPEELSKVEGELDAATRAVRGPGEGPPDRGG